MLPGQWREADKLRANNLIENNQQVNSKKRLQTEGNPDERKKYVTEIDIAENDITESTMAGFDYASYNAKLLDAHPEYELTYIVAPPRMACIWITVHAYTIFILSISHLRISVFIR